jgi:hypothetical protein
MANKMVGSLFHRTHLYSRSGDGCKRFASTSLTSHFSNSRRLWPDVTHPTCKNVAPRKHVTKI